MQSHQNGSPAKRFRSRALALLNLEQEGPRIISFSLNTSFEIFLWRGKRLTFFCIVLNESSVWGLPIASNYNDVWWWHISPSWRG